jgi:hypothetical protein
LLPEVVLLLDAVLLTEADDVPVTNSEEPHTAAFDQVDDVFQTAEGSSDMYTSSEVPLKVAIGDIAVPFATSVLLRAASTST